MWASMGAAPPGGLTFVKVGGVGWQGAGLVREGWPNWGVVANTVESQAGRLPSP